MKPRVVILIIGIIFLLTFGSYLAVLFRQVESAFLDVQEFVPTRVYSDLSKISVPQQRKHVEARLNLLRYKFAWDSKNHVLTFNLHPILYPTSLLPESHPQAAYSGQTPSVRLEFMGPDPTDELDEVELDGVSISEVFLEPELVATLSGKIEGDQSIREVLKFSEIPAHVWQAIIAIEDQHFLSHKGMDPRGIARAILVNLKSMSFKQGGSTITQQLVKNLMARRTKNLFKKANELLLAFLLELRFSKEEILERYLNEVYLGQVGSYEVHGVSEGAKHFFGKRLEELNLSEIALMAGLIRGPGYYSPYRQPERAFDRQKLVLQKMVETGQIAEEEALEAKDQKVNLAPPISVSNKAPYFVDYVKAQLIQEVSGQLSTEEMLSRGFRIYTTLDSYWNRLAQDTVWKHLKDLSGIEGALAIQEHHTGKIRALIGGKNYSQSQFNRILNMKRQAGSTFKPFVFLAALEERSDGNGIPFGPAYPLEDAPWTLIYDRGRQKWSPKNYEKEFRGWITAQQVLANSINTGTAKLAVRVGLDPIIELARNCGIVSELPKVPSISLGSADVSPVELLNAYAVLANQGVEQERHVIRLITEEDGVPFARFLPKETKRVESMSVEVLRQMMETVFTEGTAKKASQWGWKRSAAGKTGTTTQHRDAWFAGFSPQLTGVVWVGEDLQTDGDNGKPETNKARLTGGGSALPIWAELMTLLHAELPLMGFSESEANVEVKIDRYTGQLAFSECDEAQVIRARYPEWALDMARSCEASYPESEKETKVDEF